ncbi:MAG: ATP-binding protein [Bacteroidetes bacterium]|nr:ATP-binding protein [Bacteroidota bacterium]
MITRQILTEFETYLEIFPIVGVVGPRQVGKTTLVKNIQSILKTPWVYLDLDLQSDKAKLANAELYLETFTNHCVIIDEIQEMPELFGLLKALVDKDKRPAKFIILGSASPKLIRKSSDALTGRIGYIELHPFNLTETGIETQNQLWLRGGFPDAFLSQNQNTWQIITQNFIKTYVERELPGLGLPASNDTSHRLFQMLAHVSGQQLNLSTIGRSLGISTNTAKTYVDFIENAFLIRSIRPYFKNTKKRLTKSPKVYWRDTGILHQLLQISNYDQLLGHPQLGVSWEAFVIQQIIANAPSELDFAYYRTQDGAEVDLLIIKGGEPIIGCEIKFTNSPKLSKGNTIALQDVNAINNFIITPQAHSYPIKENVQVCSLGWFLNYLRKL